MYNHLVTKMGDMGLRKEFLYTFMSATLMHFMLKYQEKR